ncbi:MAG: hypothetical protein UH211_11940 [Agathobacter sp.]|nr:hypothetical protein [Agathobacter sp.]
MKINIDITEDNTRRYREIRATDIFFAIAFASFLLAAILYRDYSDIRGGKLVTAELKNLETRTLSNGESVYDYDLYWEYGGRTHYYHYKNQSEKRDTGEQIVYVFDNGERAVFADKVKLGRGFKNAIYTGIAFLALWGYFLFDARISMKIKDDDDVKPY